MRILLVDDHALLREGLASMLAQQPGPLDVLHASHLAEASRQCAMEPNIALVLLDLDLPDSQGQQGIKELRERLPLARIVVLSAQEDPATVEACIDAGAAGFIHKSASFAVLDAALRQVVQGDIHLPPPVLAAAPRPAAAALDLLSSRQRAVLELLLRGASNKHIERELDLSASTVKTHMAELFRRLEVNNRTQAVLAAAALGLRLDRSHGT